MEKKTDSLPPAFLEKVLVRTLFSAYGKMDLTEGVVREMAADARSAGLSKDEADAALETILRPSALVCRIQKRRKSFPRYRLTKTGYSILSALEDGEEHSLTEFTGKSGALPRPTSLILWYLHYIGYITATSEAQAVILEDGGEKLDAESCGTIRLTKETEDE